MHALAEPVLAPKPVATASAGHGAGPVNAFSVDTEEHFQVGAFEGIVPRSDWHRFESRVERNTQRLLDLMDVYAVKGTFFTLGWVGKRQPRLVREIHRRGHEVASHGGDHRRVALLTWSEFRADVRASKQILEDATGEPVVGYRAPNFSVRGDNLWVLDVLAATGYRYDSSIFPRFRRLPGTPRFPWLVSRSGQEPFWEFPMSTLRAAGINLPFLGGNYLRQLPLAVTRWGLRRLNRVEKRPAIVYIHPWEVDPEQPRIAAPALTRMRHYRNLDKVEARLAALFTEFRFTTVRAVLGL
jgi:polysaccharide deacetylase family protein (PEP-CTERM system associated)